MCCGGFREDVCSYDKNDGTHSSRPHDVLNQTGPEFELQRFPIMTFRPTFGGSGAAVSACLSFFRAVCFINLACDCVSGRPGRYRGPQAPSFSGSWWRGDQVDSRHNIVIIIRWEENPSLALAFQAFFDVSVLF